jgi:hypothetical protein
MGVNNISNDINFQSNSKFHDIYVIHNLSTMNHSTKWSTKNQYILNFLLNVVSGLLFYWRAHIDVLSFSDQRHNLE